MSLALFSPFVLGDVIVEINGMCVLGKTHPEVVQMFQSIPINQYVDMVLCRGYPLPPDVDLDSDDPLPPPPPPMAAQPQQALHGGEVVTAVPLINGQPLLVKGDVLHGSSQELHYVTTDASGRPVVAAMPNGRQGERGEVNPGMLQPELVSVPLVKGPGGFGFAIADCPLGQKVKMILDAQWCRGLQKGDVIKEINRQNVQTLSHAQVVDILKDLPVGSEVSVLVLRGGERLKQTIYLFICASLYFRSSTCLTKEYLSDQPESCSASFPLCKHLCICLSVIYLAISLSVIPVSV